MVEVFFLYVNTRISEEPPVFHCTVGVLVMSRAPSYVGLDETLSPKLPLKNPANPSRKHVEHMSDCC